MWPIIRGFQVREIQQDMSRMGMIRAIEANIFEFCLFFRRWPQMEVHDDPEMLWTLSNYPFPLFNNVLRVQLAADQVNSQIEAAITRCKSRNVAMLWQVGPATNPADLGGYLEAHGFTHEEEVPGMAVDLQSLNESVSMPDGFTIQQIEDAETLKQWHQVFITGFDIPDPIADAFHDFHECVGFDPRLPMRNYLGLLNGEPVAISSSFFGAGVAGIYNVTTLPQARRQGIGTLITLAPLLEAQKLGYRIAILHSSETGYRVYRQLGFQEYCRISHYVWSPQNEAGTNE